MAALLAAAGERGIAAGYVRRLLDRPRRDPTATDGARRGRAWSSR